MKILITTYFVFIALAWALLWLRKKEIEIEGYEFKKTNWYSWLRKHLSLFIPFWAIFVSLALLFTDTDYIIKVLKEKEEDLLL